MKVALYGNDNKVEKTHVGTCISARTRHVNRWGRSRSRFAHVDSETLESLTAILIAVSRAG
jgi:hypothetical protein